MDRAGGQVVHDHVDAVVHSHLVGVRVRMRVRVRVRLRVKVRVRVRLRVRLRVRVRDRDRAIRDHVSILTLFTRLVFCARLSLLRQHTCSAAHGTRYVRHTYIQREAPERTCQLGSAP